MPACSIGSSILATGGGAARRADRRRRHAGRTGDVALLTARPLGTETIPVPERRHVAMTDDDRKAPTTNNLKGVTARIPPFSAGGRCEECQGQGQREKRPAWTGPPRLGHVQME